jgi:hypothetical protein
MIKTFLPKDDQELPDAYGLTLSFVTGKPETFETAEHRIFKETMTFQVVTADDEMFLFPLSNIIKIAFDKRFSKICAIKDKLNAKLPEQPNA